MSRLLAFHQKLLADPTGSFLTVLVFCLLIPFSLLYGFGSWLRLLCYRYGLLPSFKSSIPVISVGNLTAGGTGKTPVVDWLVKRLIAEGYHPAIVSRGYGGQFCAKFGYVSDGKEILMTPVECGDEPVLLAQRNPLVPVLIACKRVNAIKEIERTNCADVVILDDGFQHLAVKRDVNLVLVDSLRPFGNGWPLPAGNLRGFRCELKRSDIILRTRFSSGLVDIHTTVRTYRASHLLATEVVSLDGVVIPMEMLKGLKLAAFAGIADPDSFFLVLENFGLQLVEKLSFSDHKNYSTEVIAKINQLSNSADAYITTEKDAVKLKDELFRLPCYQVPLFLSIEAGENLIQTIIEKVRSRL